MRKYWEEIYSKAPKVDAFEEVEVAGILLGVPRRTGSQAGIERVGLSHNVRSGEAEAALPWASSFCGTSRVCRISLFNALALAYWDFGTEVEDTKGSTSSNGRCYKYTCGS